MSPTGDLGLPDWQAQPGDAVDVTLSGAGVMTVRDNWFVTRYRNLGACGNTMTASEWAGDPASTTDTLAMLAPGWVKRVVEGLNPFDQRVSDFHDNEVATYASMVLQAGEGKR